MEPPYGGHAQQQLPTQQQQQPPQPYQRELESLWAGQDNYFNTGSLPSLEALSGGTSAPLGAFPSHLMQGSLGIPSGLGSRPRASLPSLYPTPSTPVPNFFGVAREHGAMRPINPATKDESKGGVQLRPREVIPLFDIALGRTSIVPALCHPAFARDGSGRFVCGTEEQHPHRVKSNHLIFGHMDLNTGKLMTSSTGAPTVWTQPITNHVRDIQWVDDQLLIVAIASTLVLMRLPQHVRTDLATINFPPFHKDIIREIAVSPAKRNLLLSGGFDGSVFVTDISRLCEDITSDQQHSENSIYPCGEVVGSVSWHPSNPWLASCTTDSGTLHIFDIRTDPGGGEASHQSLLYNTTKSELYTHIYSDEHTILLGFGDGQIHMFDTRMQRTIQVYQDPYQRQIGEIRVDQQTGVFATFGVPEFTLWRMQDNTCQLWGHNNMCPPHLPNNSFYKTSGEFLARGSAIVLTDSSGMMSYFDVPSSLCLAS